jgi:Tfp pilus assembly protein PilW
MISPASPSCDRRGEHGFTLVEMLVTLVTGIIVILATLSVLDISIGESSRISERVDADQRGRLAMEKILQELHSSCIAAGVTPVEANSTGTVLKLISQTGSETFFPNVTEHVITYTEATHTLSDASFVSTEEKTRGEWLFPTTATRTQTLLTGVSESIEEKTGLPSPIFKYYRYEGGNLSTTALTTPLSATQANETAAVAVRFTTAPTSERTTGGRTVDLSDTAVLRFDPASATGSDMPCG